MRTRLNHFMERVERRWVEEERWNLAKGRLCSENKKHSKEARWKEREDLVWIIGNTTSMGNPDEGIPELTRGGGHTELEWNRWMQRR